MKRTFFSLLLLALLGTIASCSSGDDTSVTILEGGPTALSFSKLAGSNYITISSNTRWSITSSATWCTVSTASGSGNQTYKVAVNVTANDTYDDRSAVLTVSSGDKQLTVNVTQALTDGLILKSESSMKIDAAGGSLTVSLQSTALPTVKSDASWLVVADTRTLSNHTVTLNVAANTAAERTGKVSFTVGDLTEQLTVVQAAGTSADTKEADKTGMDNDAVPLAEKMYAGWNLGNSLESTGGETAWGNPATSAAIIAMVKAAGFNAVRIPVAWNGHLSDAATYTIDATWMARVKQVVDYVTQEGMYAIVNIHWDGGWLENNITTAKEAAVTAEQKALWKQIAICFRDYDEHLLFAACNEPNVSDATGMAVLKNYEQTFVDAVRATGGRNAWRNLIVQGPSADIEKTCQLMTMPSDTRSNRMMLEVHYYSPWQFCGLEKDESWGNMAYFWGSQNNQSNIDGVNRNSTWGDETYMKGEFAKMKTQFVDKGYPVILGEYGAMRRTMATTALQTAHDTSVAEFIGAVTKNAKTYGMVPFVWDMNGAMSLFNRGSLTVRYQQFLDALMQGAKDGKYPF